MPPEDAIEYLDEQTGKNKQIPLGTLQRINIVPKKEYIYLLISIEL